MLARINWAGLIVSAGVVLVSLLAIELIARAFVPQWAPPSADRTFWVYDEQLGWAHLPGSSGPMHHQDFSIDVSHNALGMRDAEVATEVAAGHKRILLLGSSFSWGYGVEREEIYAEVIDSKYPDWEVVNAAVSGYSTDQELLSLEAWGPKLQPDVVILMLHHHDVAGNLLSARYWHNKPVFEAGDEGLTLRGVPVPPTGIKERIQNYVFSETYFFSKLAVRFRSATKKSAGKERSRKGFDLTRDLLLRIDEVTRGLGARLVVILPPTSRDDWLEFISAEMSSAGIDHVGLSEAFQNKTQRLKFEHDPHWNPAGHRLVAGVVEGYLLERGILP